MHVVSSYLIAQNEQTEFFGSLDVENLVAIDEIVPSNDLVCSGEVIPQPFVDRVGEGSAFQYQSDRTALGTKTIAQFGEKDICLQTTHV